MYHDKETLKRCVQEGSESFRIHGYHDPRGCPYRDNERAQAWHRGVFRADHWHNGNLRMVMDDDSFFKDLWREIDLSKLSTTAFAGEY